MRLFGLSVKNLGRHRSRSLLTVASLAVSFFIFAALQSVVSSLDANIVEFGKLPIAVVGHRAGLNHFLPEAYADRIRRVPGVKNVVAMLYLGGSYGDMHAPTDALVAVGGDSVDALRTIWGKNLIVSDEDWARFMSARDAALVGPQLQSRFGWKPGQKVTLNGTNLPIDLTFTVAGTASFRTDQSLFLYHREYADQAMKGGFGEVTLFWAEVESAEALPEIAGRIDRALADTSEPIRTISEQELTTWYLGMVGDIRGAVRAVAAMVLVAMLFVTSNSIAISTRARHAEIATLKAIGFSSFDVGSGVVMESVLECATGSAVGLAAAYLLFSQRALSLGTGPLSGFHVAPSTVEIGMAASVLVGAAAAAVPAWRVARTNVVTALRRVS
jgi:putative ABC transport system permease protein